MRIAMDANRYADFCRGVPRAVEVVQAAQQIAIPFVVLAEIECGIVCGSRSTENRRIINKFLASPRCSILYPDDHTIRFYGELYGDLRKAGTPIPTNDLWIAALVWQHDLALFTRDRHFERVTRIAKI
jgi:tRNA(fMet)-specific endonuclease VapC